MNELEYNQKREEIMTKYPYENDWICGNAEKREISLESLNEMFHEENHVQ